MKLLAPVYANAGVQAWYTRQLQTLITEMARDMLSSVRVAYRKDAPEQAMDALGDYLVTKAMERWANTWVARMNVAAATISKQFASRSFKATETSMMAALREAGFTVKFKPSKRSVKAYQAVVDQQVNLIKSIPQQYLTDVRTVVYQSVMEGGNLQRVSDAVKQKYGIAHRRAAFIAEDQNNKAKAVIERARRRELGITRAKWRHSGAGKEPRPDHVAFSGKDYDIRKGAYLEGKWVWPGSEPRCRCTDMAIIE